MTDHAVLVPTSEGPVGGIVSEPPGAARAGLLLMPGYGRPARSGVNSFWTRLARSLSERGLIVLRVDYSREGETLPVGLGVSGQVAKRELDMRLHREVLSWFRDRLLGLELMLAGSCSGARGAIELAAEIPRAIAATFLVVPHVRALEGAEPAVTDGAAGSERALASVDPFVVDCLRAVLAHSPSWILLGERDTADISGLVRLLGSTRHALEVEVAPGVALHLLDQPRLQADVAARVTARIEQALTTLPAGQAAQGPSI